MQPSEKYPENIPRKLPRHWRNIWVIPIDCRSSRFSSMNMDSPVQLTRFTGSVTDWLIINPFLRSYGRRSGQPIFWNVLIKNSNVRSRTIGAFPNEASLLRLAGSTLIDINEEGITGNRYLSVKMRWSLWILWLMIYSNIDTLLSHQYAVFNRPSSVWPLVFGDW